MGYEIDFFPVGEKKGGDAILLRYGDLNSNERKDWNLVVIDGGTKESGDLMVEHIHKYYNTEYVNSVICTHLHQDHCSGLTKILENFEVKNLFMHLPWEHSNDIKNKFANGKVTNKSVKEKLEKSLNSIKELEEIAIEKDIQIIEPFSGINIHNDGSLLILGPSEEYYNQLLANFDLLPEVKDEYKEDTGFFNNISKSIKLISASLGILNDDGVTTPENNTSIITMFKVDDKKILFTGDAGIEAINRAINYANRVNIDINNIDLLDVPHHGSKRNIGKSIINKLNPKIAIISAPTNGDPKHPSRRVVNALINSGTLVSTTEGRTICYSKDAPQREGWGPITPKKSFEEVEE